MLKTKEQVDPCKVELNIEVEPELVAAAMEQAFKQVAKRVAIPGFRKGKAPRALLDRYVDEEEVKDRAVRELVPPAYEDALKEADIEPYDLPDVEIVSFEEEQPLVFKATVPLPPKVELGEYVKLKVERMAPVVPEEDVEKQLTEMRERAAKLEPVADRPVQAGDVAGVEIQRTDGDDPTPHLQMVQAGSNLPQFDEQFIGMTVGEERVINIDYPADYQDEDLAGKTLGLKTKVMEIKERRVPELDDEFAKLVGSEDVAGLRNTLKERMEKIASDIADRHVESQLVYQVVENAQIHYPDAMIDHETEHRLHEFMHRLEEAKVELADFLAEEKKTFEELQADYRSAAEKDIKSSLALLEVAKRENITVTDEDVDAEIELMAEEKKVAKASMQAYIDRTDGGAGLRSRLMRKKVLAFLAKSSNIKNVAAKGDSE